MLNCWWTTLCVSLRNKIQEVLAQMCGIYVLLRLQLLLSSLITANCCLRRVVLLWWVRLLRRLRQLLAPPCGMIHKCMLDDRADAIVSQL